ncbi:hypothetical protein AXFE_09670 [Acidithrix ferrooxidans]|uniref:Uncharacterized protein n=1 Tax=Acidithrix ferrooxidans TaxID=1280514 RepID=A0A0D8HEJ0_9ACTN|nr:hypothetical protein AXFE_28120 [Acidithrix ferrooxidans]KJF18066.1 hypothetical protein AXFE_09670 [Acidithrix ferrooxidans]
MSSGPILLLLIVLALERSTISRSASVALVSLAAATSERIAYLVIARSAYLAIIGSDSKSEVTPESLWAIALARAGHNDLSRSSSVKVITIR